MKIMLISISPDKYVIRRTSYGYTVVIPACPKGQPYTEFVVTDQKDTKVLYHGLQAHEIERFPFDIVAEDIVKDVMYNEQLESKGVFALPDGRTIPTQAELAQARDKRAAQLTAWMDEGQRIYSKMGMPGIQHIPDYCKAAVVELGEEDSVEWVFARSTGKTECNVCGFMMKNLSNGKPPAICRECKSILDPERYEKHNPEAEVKRGPGRPRKEEVPA